MKAHRPRIWGRAALAATVTAIVAGGGGALLHGVLASSATGTTPLTLNSVSADNLASVSMHLFVPTTAEATGAIPTGTAQQDAVAQFGLPASDVREAALADVSDPTIPSIDGKTLWVVSLNPLSAPAVPDPLPAIKTPPLTKFLVFLDPSTGKFVFATYG